MLDGSSGRHGLIVVSTVMFAEGCSLGRRRRQISPVKGFAETADKQRKNEKQECCSNCLLGLGAPAASSRRRGYQAP